MPQPTCDASTEAEHTTGTAALTATATGVSAIAGETKPSELPASDQIRNDGTVKVTAVAGEDENGNPQTMIFAKSHILVRDSHATATGTSTVDATGIRVGNRGAEVVNSGTIDVLAREYATLSATAFSGIIIQILTPPRPVTPRRQGSKVMTVRIRS